VAVICADCEGIGRPVSPLIGQALGLAEPPMQIHPCVTCDGTGYVAGVAEEADCTCGHPASAHFRRQDGSRTFNWDLRVSCEQYTPNTPKQKEKKNDE